MSTHLARIVAIALTTLVWSASAGAAGVQQRAHEAAPRGGHAHEGRGYDPSPGRYDSRGRQDRGDRRRGAREDDDRRGEHARGERDYRDRDDAHQPRSSGGVIMRQPHGRDRWRERAPADGPYAPSYGDGPYGPYGPYAPPRAPYQPYQPYGPYGPYTPPERRGR